MGYPRQLSRIIKKKRYYEYVYKNIFATQTIIENYQKIYGLPRLLLRITKKCMIIYARTLSQTSGISEDCLGHHQPEAPSECRHYGKTVFADVEWREASVIGVVGSNDYADVVFINYERKATLLNFFKCLCFRNKLINMTVD